MRFTLVCIILTGLAGARILEAQQTGWGLTAEVGSAGFGGHAKSAANVTPEASGHPTRATTVGLRVDRSTPRLRLSLGARVASMGVEFENDDISVGSKNILDLLEIAPEIAMVVLRRGENVLLLHGEIVMDRWSPDGADSRTRVAGGGGATLEAPLFRRIAVQVRYDAVIGNSLFEEDDLTAEFTRQTGWQQRWSIGVRYGM